MKKLITNNSGGHLISLDDFRHTQEGVSESINSFAKSLIPEGVDRCILHGCVLTVVGAAFSLSAGAIYYQGEVYQVNAQNGTTNGLAYWVISVTYAALNPITYQDGISHSVHQIRQAVLQYFPGAPDVGAFAFTTTLKLSDLFTATLNASVILDLTYDIGDWKFCNNLTANFNLTTGLAKPGSKYAGKWAMADGRNQTQNMAGRVPVGFDPSQTEFNSIGKAGGVKEVTLTTPQIPRSTTAVALNRYELMPASTISTR